MNSLPDNAGLTQRYCTRFCGILLIDGKYVKVKGYKQKIPFIYGIDYLTHDIPVGLLAPSENTQAFLKFFGLLKRCNYPLQIVVCDDVISALKPALLYWYPNAKIQLCHNHYIENIRQLLRIRTQQDHRKFFHDLCKEILDKKQSPQQRNTALHTLFTKRAKKNILRQHILIDIHTRREYLFAYKNILHCPNTTNLIELYNSHLNARLNALKGFKSFTNAQRWLNAWMIRRRTKSFTDCKDKFKHLNGKCSLQMTIKKQTDLSDLSSKYALKFER